MIAAFWTGDDLQPPVVNSNETVSFVSISRRAMSTNRRCTEVNDDVVEPPSMS